MILFTQDVRKKKIGDLSVERIRRMVSQQRSDFRGRLRKTNPVIFQTVFPSGLHDALCKAIHENTISIFRCEKTERIHTCKEKREINLKFWTEKFS